MIKLQRVCLKIIACMGVLIFGYLAFYAWTSSARIYAYSEAAVWSEDRIWKNLLFTMGVLLMSAAIGVLTDRLNDRLLHAAAVIVSLTVTIVCCILAGAARAYPTADQIYVYEAAVNFFTGDYTNIQTEWYFNACPYQLGLGLLYGILMKAFGRTDYFVIQYTQAVCAGVIVYSAFRLTRELFRNRKASAAVLFCTASFLPIYLYTLYLYGETLGVCFAMLGLLFWLSANNRKTRKKGVTGLYWVLSALCLILCYTARLALIIVLIAMVIMALLKAFLDQRWKLLGLTMLILFLALGGQKQLVAYMETKADVELADGMPAILTVAMGIQDEDENGTGPGSYNAYNLWLYFGCGFDGESAASEAFSNIRQTLYRWSQDPAYMVNYMNQKVLNQWNEATYGAFFMTAEQQDPKEWVNDFYRGTEGDRWYEFLNLYQGMLYAMIFLYFVKLLGETDDIFSFVPGVLLIGEFCFSMLWEAKSRYIYPYIVMAMPCLARSLIYCTETFQEYISKRKNK